MKTNTYPDFEILRAIVKEYIEAIGEIDFAKIEMESLNVDPQTPEEILDDLVQIVNTAKELNLIIEQSPASIYIADADGVTLRMNTSFEQMSRISRDTLRGKNTGTIEEEGVFVPSVCSLALKEGRRIISQQVLGDNIRFVTTGVPVVNEKGDVFRVTPNAILNEDIENMNTFFNSPQEEDLPDLSMNGKMVMESEAMKSVIRLADMIKDTESTILIEGETGVGKSLLARYIHRTSNRSRAKMMEINCGAIPEALLESELFGYVSGAFTGADKKGKPGIIEVCEGGTIFLDEISELPLTLQVKLLHFLQEKKIVRIGGTEEIPVNVRVIAAANKNLSAMVEDGTFREDLFYRLNVIPIVIPPLRERKEDIAPAVDMFLKKYTTLYGRGYSLQKDCMEQIERLQWHGNLRELENYIERLVLTGGKTDALRSGPQEESAAEAHRGKTMEEIEREMILEAYEQYGSSYKVAKALGISQSTANRRIRKYLAQRQERTE